MMERRAALGLLAAAVPAAAWAGQGPRLRGRLAQGGLVFGQAPEGAAALLDGQAVKTAPDGRFMIGFSRDAGPAAALRFLTRDGQSAEHKLTIAKRAFTIQDIKGLRPETVLVPPELQPRRDRELAMIGAARRDSSDSMGWWDGFAWPVKGRITGGWGRQRILNGMPRTPHWGTDIAAPTGTPVLAPAAGAVRLAERDFLLEGGLIIIDHGFNLSSAFLHMSRVDVAAGDTVKQGQPIGAVGALGRATGPHLCWRVKWGDVWVDSGLLPGLPVLKS